MDVIVLFIVAWAVTNVIEDWRAGLRKSRKARIAEREKELAPAKMTPSQRKVTAARHDTGWWLREAIHGFPVARHGWRAGWVAHQAAHEQHRAILAEHKGVRDSWRQVRRQGKQNLRAVEDAPPSLSRDQLKQKIKAASPPAQTQGQQSPVPSAAPAPKPATAGASAPSPAVAAPPCISCGCPAGDDAQPGRIGDATGPMCADCAEWSDGNLLSSWAAATIPGEPSDLHPQGDQDNQPGQSPTTNGVAVTATTEYTYEQTIAEANHAVQTAETLQHEIASLGIPQMIDALSVSGVDRGNLSLLDSVHTAYERIVAGARDLSDASTAFRDGMVRAHGGVNEAHQAAPEGGAEKPFYVGS